MTDAPLCTLSCNDLTVTVPGRTLVENLSFRLNRGEFLAVLGQNGSGKSLTLHTLAGLRRPATGEVVLHGHRLSVTRRRTVAKQLALLPQQSEDIFPSTVLDTVLIGRHPHIERFQWESTEDRQHAQDALQAVDMQTFADRDLMTLSGGERRRVAIAQVLAQDPEVYLLDEPANHLDPQHQIEVLQMFRRRSRSAKTVVASLHDANLAMRFADRCLMLFGDGRWLLGASNALLNAANLSELYAMPVETISWRNKPLFVAAGAPDP
jgi:iron complex transport system ATP-binding protein